MLQASPRLGELQAAMQRAAGMPVTPGFGPDGEDDGGMDPRVGVAGGPYAALVGGAGASDAAAGTGASCTVEAALRGADGATVEGVGTTEGMLFPEVSVEKFAHKHWLDAASVQNIHKASAP